MSCAYKKWGFLLAVPVGFSVGEWGFLSETRLWLSVGILRNRILASLLRVLLVLRRLRPLRARVYHR